MEETTRLFNLYSKYVIIRQMRIDEFKREYSERQIIESDRSRFIKLDKDNLVKSFENNFEKYRNHQINLFEMTHNILHNHDGEICRSKYS
jgi:hypothetical protein